MEEIIDPGPKLLRYLMCSTFSECRWLGLCSTLELFSIKLFTFGALIVRPFSVQEVDSKEKLHKLSAKAKPTPVKAKE